MINLDLSEKKWTKVHKKYQKWSILESFTVEQCSWSKNSNATFLVIFKQIFLSS